MDQQPPTKQLKVEPASADATGASDAAGQALCEQEAGADEASKKPTEQGRLDDVELKKLVRDTVVEGVRELKHRCVSHVTKKVAKKFYFMLRRSRVNRRRAHRHRKHSREHKNADDEADDDDDVLDVDLVQIEVYEGVQGQGVATEIVMALQAAAWEEMERGVFIEQAGSDGSQGLLRRLKRWKLIEFYPDEYNALVALPAAARAARATKRAAAATKRADAVGTAVGGESGCFLRHFGYI